MSGEKLAPFIPQIPPRPSVAKCFDLQRFLGFVELKETNTSWDPEPWLLV